MTLSRWRWRMSVASLAVAVGFVVYPIVESGDDVVNSDWPAFATGARLIVENPSHLYDLDVQRPVQAQVTGGKTLITLGISGILPFLSPAWVALLAVPFEALGTNAGGRLWILFGLACLGLGLLLAVRPRPPTAMLAAFSSVPTALLLLNAQLDGLVVLGIGAAIALRNRPWLVGLPLSLTLVKPNLVLPIGAALVVARQWRALMGWAIGGLMLTGVAWLFDPLWVVQFLGGLHTTVQTGAREVDAAHFGIRLGLGAASFYAVWAITGAVLVAVLLAARRMRDDFTACAAILIAGGVVAAPHALPTDLVLAAAALAVWGRAAWHDWLALSAAAVVCVLAPPPVPALVGTLEIAWLVGRILGLTPTTWWRREWRPASAG